MDVLEQAAKSFEKLSELNYEFVLGRNKKTIFLSVSANKDEFTHTIGLDHLKDIWQVSSHKSKDKKKFFDDIKKGIFTYDDIKNNANNLFDSIPKSFNSLTGKEYTIDERIKKFTDISLLMDNAYKGCIYKWEVKNCQVRMPNGNKRNVRIAADYLIVLPSTSSPDEHLYLFAYQKDNSLKKDNKIFISIHSAFADCVDLTRGQDKPYVILQETKVNTKTNETEVLYTHPSYEKSKSAQPQQHNDNIKQIKFDNPTPQNILHNNSGAAAAVIPAPNPFKNLIDRLKNIFKKQDKHVEAAATVQTNDKTNIAENKMIVNESPVPKELTALIEAREAFAAGNLPQAEYEQAVSKYMSSLHGRKMWTEAAESLRKQLEKCPDNMKKYIRFELKHIELTIEKKFPSQRKQTLDEIKSAAYEQYVKLQTENKAAEKEITTVKSKSER